MNDEIMYADELRRSLADLGWGPTALADQLGADERTARRWMSGQFLVPIAVAAWLRALVVAHRANPPPLNWRGRTLSTGR